MSTTNQGVADTSIESADVNGFTTDEAADAFLNRWSVKESEDNESSSKDPETRDEEEEESEAQAEDEAAEEEAEETEETDEDPQEDSEESDNEEEDSETEEVAKKTLDDDAVVKIKVDDEELEVSVKNLKRLYGQEAALTRKSQQVAEQRKAVETEGTKLAASLQRLYAKAEERYKPYAEIDMLVASKQLDADTFAALRKEAKEAYDDFRFITEEVDSFVKQTEQQRQLQQQEAAKEAVKVLKDKIPTWSPQVYDSIREYAIAQGMDPAMVNSVTNPHAIEMMYKARMYDESKKIVTKKKVITPKKTLKTTASVVNAPRADKAAKQVTKLRSTGTTDDAADVFLSRWMSEE